MAPQNDVPLAQLSPEHETILKSIPPPKTLGSMQRASYIIVGPPGSGKTTLAKKLAAGQTLSLLSPEAMIEKSLGNVNAPMHAAMTQAKLKSGSFDTELLLRAYEAHAKSQESSFKGFVMDGLPCGLSDANGTPADIQTLETILKNKESHHVSVLIKLAIGKDDLIRRRTTQFVDPVTNTVYTAAHVAFAHKKIAEENRLVLDNGEDGEEEVEEVKKDDREEEAVFDDEDESDLDSDEDEENGQDGGDDDVDAMKKARRPRTAPFPIQTKGYWSSIAPEVLNRLIKRQEDDLQLVEQEYDAYVKSLAYIDKMEKAHFDSLRVLTIDATQHPEIVQQNVDFLIDTLGFSIFNRAIEAKAVPPPPGGYKSMADGDIVKYLTTAGLEPEDPVREIGPWGRYCPVSYLEGHQLVESPLANAATCRGIVFFFATEENIQKFLANPDKYLCKPAKITNISMCVIGGPFSGKTSQAKVISRAYDLVYLSMDEIMARWDRMKDQVAAKTKYPIYAQVVALAKAGKDIPDHLIVSVYKDILKPNTPEYIRGWVMDGFPRTVEQAQLLIEAGLTPQYTVLLENDINDINIRARGETILDSSIPGQPIEPFKWGQKRSNTYMPPIAIQAFPHFDNLYNGFREEFHDMMKTLEDSTTHLITVTADQQIQTVLSMIQTVIDPFVPKATLPLKGAENDAVDIGYTKDYCPVSLKNGHVLRKGNKALSAKYLGYTYYLSSEEYRQAFMAEPHSFVNAREPMQPPPVRIMFIGPTGAGKTSCIKELKQWGVPHLDFDEFLKDYISKQPEETQKEIEYMIKENSGMLSPPVIFSIVQNLFVDGPYAKTGFLLEGFPRTKLETEVMLKNGFHVDAFLYLKTDPDIISRRRVIQARQQEIARLAAGEKPAEKSVLFLEPEGIDELADGFEEQFDKELNRLIEITQSVESLSPTPIIEVDAAKPLRTVLSIVRKKLRIFLDYRPSLFSNAQEIPDSKAEILLKNGIKSYSHFGKLCPVQLHNNKAILHSSLGIVPVLYGDHIYFLKNRKAVKEFIQNTLTYVRQPEPEPVIRPTVWILGRPKSGKTLFAQRIAKEYGMIYLSVPQILQSLVENPEDTQLHDDLKKALHYSQTLTPALTCQAVRQYISRAYPQNKGWVLDGYPQTLEEAQALDLAGLSPHQIIELDINHEVMLERTEKDRLTNIQNNAYRLDFADISLARSENYDKDYAALKKRFVNKYANWMRLDGSRSVWSLSTEISKTVKLSLLRRQRYHYLKALGRAAPIDKIGANLAEIAQKTGKFWDYCPVRLLDYQELAKGSPGTHSMAEYKGFYYRMKSTVELDAFLKDPERYINGASLPKALPVKRVGQDAKSIFPRQLELRGYCPVTFQEGPSGFQSIVPGTFEFLVEYDDKLYVFANKKQQEKFMRTPQKYINLTLPKKLPPLREDISVAKLPLVGYLEQTVASSLMNALSAVGKLRPKYPYKSLSVSACEFVSLFLRANNPKEKDWVKHSYAKRLAKYKEMCEILPFICEALATKQLPAGQLPPFLPLESRPPGLDANLDRFFGLRTEEPEYNRLPSANRQFLAASQPAKNADYVPRSDSQIAVVVLEGEKFEVPPPEVFELPSRPGTIATTSMGSTGRGAISTL